MASLEGTLLVRLEGPGVTRLVLERHPVLIIWCAPEQINSCLVRGARINPLPLYTRSREFRSLRFLKTKLSRKLIFRNIIENILFFRIAEFKNRKGNATANYSRKWSAPAVLYLIFSLKYRRLNTQNKLVCASCLRRAYENIFPSA